MEKKFYEYRGLGMRYLVLGDGGPLLWLHSGGTQAKLYLPLFGKLSEDFQIIAPDIPGHGVSDFPPEDWNLSEFADYLNCFMESFEFESFMVVGCSLGGGIAAAMAAKNSNIKKLVLIDSAGIAPSYSEYMFWWKMWLKTWKQIIGRRFYVWRLVNGAGFNILKNSIRFRKVLKIVHRCIFTQHKFWKDIKAETLILWGKDDILFPLDLAERMTNLIPNATLKVVEGDHDWYFFDKKKCIKLIKDFVR